MVDAHEQQGPVPAEEGRAPKRIKFSGLPRYDASCNIAVDQQPAVCPVSGEPIWTEDFNVSKATNSTDSIKRELAAVKQLYSIYKIQYHALMEDLASQHSQLKASGSSAWKAPEPAPKPAAGTTEGTSAGGGDQLSAVQENKESEDVAMGEATASQPAADPPPHKDDGGSTGTEGMGTAEAGPHPAQAAGTSGSQDPVSVRHLLHHARNKGSVDAAHAPEPASNGHPHAAPASPSHAGTASAGAVHGDSQQGVGATSFANWMGAPHSTPQSVNRPPAGARTDASTAQRLPAPAAPTPLPAASKVPPATPQHGVGPAAADGSSPAVPPAAGAAGTPAAGARPHASQALQATSTLHDPELGYGSDGDPLTFSDAEEVILEAAEGPAPGEGASEKGVGGASCSGLRVASAEQLALWRGRFAGQLGDVVKLEALASALTEQELDASGALACLVSRTGRYLLQRATVSLGRSTDGKGEVDVDLSAEGRAGKVSRRQAFLSLEAGGQWRIVNAGRRPIHVDGQVVVQFESAALGHLGLLEVGGLQLMLMVNSAAVERVLRRTARAAI